jgi:hypothetical protein
MLMTQLTFDKTGFPMLRIRKLGAFHLWPVTKCQFEQFMSETDRYGDKWYDSIRCLNEPISFENLSEGNYERLFMTGILPREAMDFARWLGEDFDLPTEEEWKKFYRVVKSLFDIRLSPYGLSDSAVALGRKIDEFLHTPLTFSFLQGGVVEWLKGEKGYVGRGTPRDSFFPNAWNPLNDSIRAIDRKERIFYFGFRLIRRKCTALSKRLPALVGHKFIKVNLR